MATHLGIKERKTTYRFGRSASQRTASGQPGFTLVELLVVLSVLAGLSALVPLALPQVMPGLEAKAAARSIVATLTSARTRSWSRNRPTAVRFDLAAKAYALEGEDVIHLPPDLALTLITAAREVDGPQQGRLVFFPDGTATGGEVRVEGAGPSRRITIDWLTAEIDLVEETSP